MEGPGVGVGVAAAAGSVCMREQLLGLWFGPSDSDSCFLLWLQSHINHLYSLLRLRCFHTIFTVKQ